MLKAMALLRRFKWFGYGIAASFLMLSASCDDGGCKDEELVALELHINNPNDLKLKVTAELESERECLFFDQGMGRVYTCWEQGGGTYKVRIYVDDQVLYEEEDEVEADACHVKGHTVSQIDLTGLTI
jgi:hypothetical protein